MATLEMKFTELAPCEKKRTYHFPGGEKVELHDVERIRVSDSGTHRLETGDGRKHIVPPGWLHIEINVEEWTF